MQGPHSTWETKVPAPPEEEEEEVKQDKRVKFKTLAQETTLHGIRKVFDSEYSWIRRSVIYHVFKNSIALICVCECVCV